MRDADARLKSTEQNISKTESEAKKLGDVTNVTARSFDKLRETLSQSQQKLNVTAEAFSKGAATANQMRSALLASENASNRLNSALKDSSARLTDAANKQSAHTKSLSLGVTAGNLAANAISRLADEARQFAVDGVKMNATLDKLVRFTATLDKNFQSPIALKKFKEDIKQLATEIPFSAEKIADASFSIKSAFSDLSEPQTIAFLRQFGLAATASNADIADFTKNTVALAKTFKVELADLPSFMAKVNTTFKQGLAADSEVAQGFNKLTTSIKSAKLSTEDFLAAFSTIQGTTADAAGATTNLQNALAKLGDAKYIEGLEKVFNVERFTKEGGLKSLNQIVNELAKSLAGLTDEQKLSKLNSVFKDLQANQGMLALINNVETYNRLLSDASGAEAYKNTQTLMLDSVESRWTRFYNNIANDQSGAGAAISDFFLSAFDSTTVVGGVAIFFNNIAGAVLQGVTSLLGTVDSYLRPFSEAFGSLFLSDESLALMKQQNQKATDALNSLYSGIGKEIEANNRFVLENQKKYWEDFAKSTADPTAKAQALKNVDDLTKSIQRSITGASVGQYDAWKKLGDTVLQGLGSADNEAKKRAFDLGKSVVDEINKALANPNLDPSIAAEFKKLLDDLKKSLDAAAPQIQQSSYRLGTNVWQGLVNGINSGRGAVSQAASALAGAATVAAQDKLQTASPSKVFFGIGKDTAQGFINGINALKASAQSAMAGMLDISNIKTTKSDKAGVELLTSLANEIARMGVDTKELNTILDLSDDKYLKLNKQIREIIITAAKFIDTQGNLTDGTSKLNSILENLTEATSPAQTALEKLNKDLADKNVTLALNQQTEAIRAKTIALARLRAMVLDDAANPFLGANGDNGRDNTGGGEIKLPDITASVEKLKPPPELPQQWNGFFDLMRTRISEMGANLPTLSESLTDSLGNALEGIGSIFGDAFANFNGSFKDLFASIGQGFKRLAGEIIGDLIRILVYKALFKLLGAFASSGGGGGEGFSDFGSMGGGGGGGATFAAAGGFISGRGTSTSDSIPAMLSNGEYVVKAAAVGKFGTRFFDAINSMQMPKMAYAGGGYVGSMPPMSPVNNSTSNQRVTHITMNVNGVQDVNGFRRAESMIVRSIQQRMDMQRED